MDVTPQQRQQLAIVLQQYMRQRQQLAQQQSQLCGSLANDTARKLEKLCLGGSSGDNSSSTGSSRDSQEAAAAAAAAGGGAAGSVEGIVSRMTGTLWGFTTTTQMLAQCMLNTLSKLQLAKMIVASYPFLPQAGASKLLLLVLVVLQFYRVFCGIKSSGVDPGCSCWCILTLMYSQLAF
jgi:hypothetical protein